jgi:peroxiredoxin Q/BCP
MPDPLLIPAFDLPAYPGGHLRSGALQGHPTVLYFYPKDSTSGCTVEAVEFTALHPRFRQLGIGIVGVSRDSLRSHEKFALKYAIPFPLVADTESTLCRACDVIREKSLYGRKYLGIDRSTFFFDAEGRLRAVWHNVKARGHAQVVLERVMTTRMAP